ncbi:MAG: helicase-related protein [Candidatus Longimicrobiales bacterium M2_2A_002]
MAFRILRAVFGEEEAARPFSGPAGARTHALTPFQEAAVERVRRALERRGGVLLADAVGLGKTYVALAVAEERLRTGADVLVLVPAALRTVWSRPLHRIAGAAEQTGRVRILSHTQLSRGVTVPETDGPRMVIVDEAHRFRNPATLRYRALARLMSAGAGDTSPRGPGGARSELLLVTATPVNNALTDLYHLVRLFLPDDGLRGSGVASVRAVFDTDPPDPAGLRVLVRELIVRRSRPMVERRYGAIRTAPGRGGTPVGFPRRAPPRIHRYRDPRVPLQVNAIETLELAVYGPGAAPLARLGLLKRMDSSPAAFAVSLRRLRAYLEACAEAARAGRLLQPGDRTAPGDGDPLQLPLLGIVAAPAPPDIDLDALAASAVADRRTVDALMRDTPADGAGGAKADALSTLLDSLTGEAVLVFTEYRDTAASLWRELSTSARVARIDGSGAWLGTHPAGRRTVVERFAPFANHRPMPPERERVEVLIATDVLAEGLNLQDARHVISYDLPWNPVRLLQRIGRVDRMGSPHDEVVPHLFVPAHGLDAALGLTRRLRAKLHGISAVLDEPQTDALLQGLAAGRCDRVETAIRAVEGDDLSDPWERLRTLWLTARAGGTATPAAKDPLLRGQCVWGETLLHGETRSLGETLSLGETRRSGELRRSGHPEGQGVDGSDRLRAVVLLSGPPSGGGREPDAQLLEVTTGGGVRPLGDTGADALARALAGDHSCGDPAGEGPADRLRPILAAVAGQQTTLAARDSAPVALGTHDPAARLARRVRGLLANAGAGLSPVTIREAERVLRVLSAPLPPAVGDAVARFLGGDVGPDPQPADLVAAAADLLGSWGLDGRDNRAADTGLDTTVRAVLITSSERG